ncbi:DUF3052 family protein [Rhodanobacter sp. 7MK24]|uniref:DUF3052 family protein n=1 Tax=Rhodanobacter sp. 7MK24 TaxID=2775922 RepID=UPI001784B610|nr:DUF3052 family protein [Rhodanobacter sp. 7MK24]MBD8882361.1 DUF3052 family protein [Rhodanobacter sp. 7MK24]
MPSSPGYSGTPLAQKLGIKPGSRVCAIGAPDNYVELLAPLPNGVEFEHRPGPLTQVAHVFATQKADLARQLIALRQKLAPHATIWVSWPKKASKVPTTVTEDTIRELAFPLDLVDVKVCAVTETWSGLKLVVRKERR